MEKGKLVKELEPNLYKYKDGKWHKNRYFLYECFCGKLFSSQITPHKIGTCGCINKGPVTHNKCYTSEYVSWASLKQRYLNPNDKKYKDYGGRGIIVCDRWLDSFDNFYADMGSKPTPKYTIDRIDNNKGYSPGNCRWATMLEQSRNKRSSILLEYKGESKTLKEWEKITGLSYDLLHDRITKGKSLEEIFEPIQKGKMKNNIKIKYNGQEWLLFELSKKLGLNYGTMKNRYAKGWSDEDVVSEIDETKRTNKWKNSKKSTVNTSDIEEQIKQNK